MEEYEKVKFDDKLIESLDQILNLDCTTYWVRRDSDSSPPFPLSPESPSSPFLSPPDSPDYEDAFFSPLTDTSSPQDKGENQPNQEGKRKRGRRPLRPFDPIKKKTEEKDKYWLRGFRAYMKQYYNQLRGDLSAEERLFWREYLGTGGKPEKGNAYLSYGKKYKNYLFSQPSFARLFKEWFVRSGQEELSKKCAPNSDLWFVFYDYGEKELLNYVPSDLQDSPQTSPLHNPQHASIDHYDITMVDTDGYVDSLLCEEKPSQ